MTCLFPSGQRLGVAFKVAEEDDRAEDAVAVDVDALIRHRCQQASAPISDQRTDRQVCSVLAG